MENYVEQPNPQSAQSLADRLASLGMFARGLSHELNNPLCGIMGFAQLLSERTDLPDDVREDLQRILTESERCRDILQSLRYFAGDPGTLEGVPKEDIDIEALINELLAKSPPPDGTDLNVVFPPGFPKINGRKSPLREAFRQILYNAYNAIASMPPDRQRIDIVGEHFGNVAKVDFKDWGPGIPDDVIQSVFQPFFTTQETGMGIGLGLSLVHGAITGHGGYVSVENRENVGCKVTTYLAGVPANPLIEIGGSMPFAELATRCRGLNLSWFEATHPGFFVLIESFGENAYSTDDPNDWAGDTVLDASPIPPQKKLEDDSTEIDFFKKLSNDEMAESLVYRVAPRLEEDTRGIIVGRSSGCDIQLDHGLVSKVHMVIQNLFEPEWTIEDANSKNGTWVEMKRIDPGHPEPIQSGTLIRLGKSHTMRVMKPSDLFFVLKLAQNGSKQPAPPTPAA